MTGGEAKKNILDRLDITNQKVTVAKSFILKQFSRDRLAKDTRQLVEDFLLSVNIRKPDVIHSSVNTEESLSKAVEYISWQISAFEAIWDLISKNLLVIHSNSMIHDVINLTHTTAISGSGSTAGISFDEISIYFPEKVRAVLINLPLGRQILADADLYLQEMNIPNIDIEVEESLREAIKCFRHELFTACLAMLGRALEGAWIKLGLSLIRTIPSGEGTINIGKSSEIMTDPFFGIAKKIDKVLELYGHKDVFKAVSDRSGIKLQDLRNCAVWADAVRESRNSVHYGVRPALPNSYEKVAALLIGATPHFRMLYMLINSCEMILAKKSGT